MAQGIKFNPTPEQLTLIEELAKIGCSGDEIGRKLGVTGKTIRNRFSDLLEKGESEGNAQLKKAQFDSALGGNVSMLIWLGKNRLGQSDKVTQEIKQEGDIHYILE